MTKMTTRAAFAVAALVLTAGACGGDDESAGTDSVAEAAEAPAAEEGATNTTAAAPATTAAAEEQGGGGGSLVDALAAEIWSEAEAGDSPITSEDEARCWAEGVVDGIGEDRLNELGMTADNILEVEDLALEANEVDVVVESLFGCADVKTAFAEQFAGDFGQEGAECVAEAMDEDLVKEALTASIAGDDSQPSAEFIEKFTQIAMDCGISG